MRSLAPYFLANIACAASVDYIVVGAGTAGLVIANRLSEHPSVQVIVIEPGDDQRNNPNVTDPTKLDQPYGTPIDWQYKTVPQESAQGRVIDVPQGKAWGGTSTINGMTYVRGDAGVFDSWEHLGNDGWNWEKLYPYFLKSENYSTPNAAQIAMGGRYDPQYHGREGAVHVGYPPFLTENELQPALGDTWEALDIQKNHDLNSGEVRGFAIGPQTLDSALSLRYDASRAYYLPVEDRENLRIVKGTVKRLVWKQGCKRNDDVVAKGVEYINQQGEVQILEASSEVIVSAGTLRTPLVLEASGIGNPRSVSTASALLAGASPPTYLGANSDTIGSLLESLGIETVVDLPGVGENLIEQPFNTLAYLTDSAGAGSAFHTFVTAEDLFGAEEAASTAEKALAEIPDYAAGISEASPGGSLPASGIEKILETQHDLVFNGSASFGEVLIVSNPGSGIVASQFWMLFPFSRGSVHLGSTSVSSINSPVYDPRLFFADTDIRATIALGRLSYNFWNTAPASSVVMESLIPPEGILDDDTPPEVLAQLVQSQAIVCNHALGSAAMMDRALGGVVDSELKVYGTKNVRVVDASVLPTQISGHLTAVIYAVAEKAADAIKAAKK